MMPLMSPTVLSTKAFAASAVRAAAGSGSNASANPAVRPAVKPRRERVLSLGIGVLIGVDEIVVACTSPTFGPAFLTQLEAPVLKIDKPRLGITVCTFI
jgi:hypothetical protein